MPVVDASAVIAWLTPEDRSDDVAAALAEGKRTSLTAPSLLDAEVANVLRTMRRRGELDDAYVAEALERYFRLNVTIEEATDRHSSLRRAAILSRDHDLTVYDAIYLELAIRSEQPLISLDRALTRAAEACGVRILP